MQVLLEQLNELSEELQSFNEQKQDLYPDEKIAVADFKLRVKLRMAKLLSEIEQLGV